MKLILRKSRLHGTVAIPGSKSHTIRAVAIAALAEGESVIREPLESQDTDAVVRAYEALGAKIKKGPGAWHVTGTGGRLSAPQSPIDVGNSGTTLRIAMGSCALLREGTVILTGDRQIQRRPAGPLAQSLNDLGARVRSVSGNGCPPFEVSGQLAGGETSIECVTSQYLTSLLMSTPLAEGDSTIRVTLLNEKPYIGITLDWLDEHGIRVEYTDDYSKFHVPGRQQYAPVDKRVPGDFSSATFFLAAGALGDNDIRCEGLDHSDTQGDRAVADFVAGFGARLTIEPKVTRVQAGSLRGCEIDLNATPDALPMMAVLACFAEGTTRLVNVAQARIKETDRIAVMRMELEKMGAQLSELEDGLVIEGGTLRGAEVDGHDDHRVVMALAIAGTMCEGETVIHGAEAFQVTYPGFVDALRGLNAELEVTES
ncbi:MAG: 3-phosphoshikimate 1-carboxyvinyltransferase [Candidatus Hydrogenedentes bacterium]|nr:3-phosphoshikimate 1-carboxyvinyltransferase [Candidatus Hydrogenedentota bacterium]